MSERVGHVAAWVISEHSGEMPVTRTKLVKLLYLSDVISYRNVGRRLFSFPWVKYHYGPYSDVVVSSVSECSWIQEQRVSTERGVAYKYRVSSSWPRRRLRSYEFASVFVVVRRYESVDTTDVVAEVCSRREVDRARKYEVVEFSDIG